MCVCAAAGWQCVKTNNNNKTEIENRQRKARRTEREKVSSGSVDKLISHRWCFEPLIFLPLLLLLVTIPHTHTLLQFRLFIRFMRERARAVCEWVCVCFSISVSWIVDCCLCHLHLSKNLLCVWFHYITPRHATPHAFLTLIVACCCCLYVFRATFSFGVFVFRVSVSLSGCTSPKLCKRERPTTRTHPLAHPLCVKNIIQRITAVKQSVR